MMSDITQAALSCFIFLSFAICTDAVCEDINHDACVLMHQTRPDLCDDPNLSLSACPRYCGKCPAQCYHCDDVEQPQQCRNTTTCQDNEECMVAQVMTTDYKLRYKLGCIAKDVCTYMYIPMGRRHVRTDTQLARNRRTLNITCCATDLCNTHMMPLIQSTTTVPTTKLRTTTTMKTTAMKKTTKITTPTPTTTGSTTTTSPTLLNCVDPPASDCSIVKDVICADRALASKLCPKTCGLCP